ncbi:hypothetical protein HY212_07750 [Candidatus Pacearchaeota archaeon]|nr:hypothetical protein [Candidatus Pacearchaeota archaeon]
MIKGYVFSIAGLILIIISLALKYVESTIFYYVFVWLIVIIGVIAIISGVKFIIKDKRKTKK